MEVLVSAGENDSPEFKRQSEEFTQVMVVDHALLTCFVIYIVYCLYRLVIVVFLNLRVRLPTGREGMR